MTGERIVIIGPMRRFPNLNFPLFVAEAERFRRLGNEARTIAEDPEVIAIVKARGSNQTREDIALITRKFLENLLWATAVARLPGWDNSVGARYENETAEWLGLKIFDV